MKRYECKLAALLIIALSMLCPVEGGAYRGALKERRRSSRQHRSSPYLCSAPSNSSYLVASSCHQGDLLTVHRGKVILQVEGLARNDKLAEFEKESCSRRRPPSYHPSYLPPSPAPPVVRYRHRESGRYLCFTRRGKIRTYGQSAVESKGKQCLFKEEPLDYRGASRLEKATYHTIQSVARPGWYLGFNLAPRSTFALQKGRVGRGAMARVGWKRAGESCAFRFHSSRVEREEEAEKRLMDSILQYLEDNSIDSAVVSEAAIDERLRTSLEQERERFSESNSLDREASSGGKRPVRRRMKRVKGRRGGQRPKVRHFQKKTPRPDRRTKNALRRTKKRRKNPMNQ